MSSDSYEIIFYLAHSGAHGRMTHDTKEEYDAVRSRLDGRLHPTPVARDGKRALNSVFYYVEEHQLEFFEQCMRDVQKST